VTRLAARAQRLSSTVSSPRAAFVFDDAWSTSSEGVLTCQVPKLWQVDAQASGACVLLAKQLINPDVMLQASQLLAQPECFQLDRDIDSVDGSPTLEVMWVMEGKYLNKALADIFRETVEEQLLPLVRQSAELHGLSDGSQLVLCEALLRVYDPGQRRVHPAHYDRDALVTAMFEIDTRTVNMPSSDGGPQNGFTGDGFYVQPGADRATRVPIVMDPGDVIAHSFDLQHGVEVTSGRRVSVIFWFTDNKESCLSKARPWYSAAAERGNADAQFVQAANVYGEDPEHNAEQAQQLLRAAAVQGHFVAQNELGTMLLRGLGSKGSRPDRMEAMEWYETSAKQGYYKAMVSLADMYTSEKNEEQALHWLTRAAEPRADPAVMYRLGMKLLDASVDQMEPKSSVEACLWLTEAAEMGHPLAQFEISKLAPDDKVENWLLRSSESGCWAATKALGLRYMDMANGGVDVVKLLRLMRGQWRQFRHVPSKTLMRDRLPHICFHEGSTN